MTLSSICWSQEIGSELFFYQVEKNQAALQASLCAGSRLVCHRAPGWLTPLGRLLSPHSATGDMGAVMVCHSGLGSTKDYMG